MKKVIYFCLICNLLFIGFTAKNAFAIILPVDADINSISPIYYQNVTPPYLTSPLDTGLFFNSGDLLEISASGTWSNAPLSYNLIFAPDGNPNENIAAGYPGAGYPVAALMGKIGNGNYFFIGNNYSNNVSETGILYLGFNDTDYGNNWGSVLADVNGGSNPVPEPSTILLFSSGLVGILHQRRRIQQNTDDVKCQS